MKSQMRWRWVVDSISSDVCGIPPPFVKYETAQQAEEGAVAHIRSLVEGSEASKEFWRGCKVTYTIMREDGGVQHIFSGSYTPGEEPQKVNSELEVET